jgi:Abortive infection alpha
MNDNSIIPISDEQAKLGKEIVEAIRGLFGGLTDIFGDLPKDLVGLIAGDRVKVRRAEQLAILSAKTKKRLQDRGITEPDPPSLKLALPILAAAGDESQEELQDLWAGLLAAAMDPKRQGLVRQTLISTVKEMDAFDALVFDVITKNGGSGWTNTAGDAITGLLVSTRDEVAVSLHNLLRLNLIASAAPSFNSVSLAPLGNLLMRAIA